MVASEIITDRADRLAGENYRLRELLKRWVRTERFPATREEFYKLCDETKRALHRLGPEWADEDD
jgi:hypothetical protein